MVASDDLVLLPVINGQATYGRDPKIRIRTYKGRTLINIPPATLEAVAWGRSGKGRGSKAPFVQVFISASLIQVRGCTAADQGARPIPATHDVLANELVKEWLLTPTDRFEIPVDVSTSGAGSLVGTLPAMYRERIEKARGY